MSLHRHLERKAQERQARDETITTSEWGLPTTFRLRTWPDHHIAVVTELDDNGGPSVTNAAEYVWTAVEHHLGIDLLEGPWSAIEHYPHSHRDQPSFDLVLFSARHNGRLASVTWRPGRELVDAAGPLLQELSRA